MMHHDASPPQCENFRLGNMFMSCQSVAISEDNMVYTGPRTLIKAGLSVGMSLSSQVVVPRASCGAPK